jgi:hypothetical protein
MKVEKYIKSVIQHAVARYHTLVSGNTVPIEDTRIDDLIKWHLDSPKMLGISPWNWDLDGITKNCIIDVLHAIRQPYSLVEHTTTTIHETMCPTVLIGCLGPGKGRW